MRRLAAISVAVGAVLALSGCKTDDQPIDTAPPVVQSKPDAATPATVAWADQTVTDALAAEKSARDAGGTDSTIEPAVAKLVMEDALAYANTAGPDQAMLGLGLALNSPRNTPLTHAVLVAAIATAFPTPAGTCVGCKGKK